MRPSWRTTCGTSRSSSARALRRASPTPSKSEPARHSEGAPVFSGIIEQVGRVEAVAAEAQSRRITLETGFGDLALGESGAVNGVCLTVTRYETSGAADFFVSPETLERSNLALVEPGDAVNLERSVT